MLPQIGSHQCNVCCNCSANCKLGISSRICLMSTTVLNNTTKDEIRKQFLLQLVEEHIQSFAKCNGDELLKICLTSAKGPFLFSSLLLSIHQCTNHSLTHSIIIHPTPRYSLIHSFIQPVDLQLSSNSSPSVDPMSSVHSGSGLLYFVLLWLSSTVTLFYCGYVLLWFCAIVALFYRYTVLPVTRRKC